MVNGITSRECCGDGFGYRLRDVLFRELNLVNAVFSPANLGAIYKFSVMSHACNSYILLSQLNTPIACDGYTLIFDNFEVGIWFSKKKY
jgi:hypothetical protein